MCRAAKYLQRTTCMDIQEPAKQRQEWQERNVRIENWTKKRKEELWKIDLACI